MFYSQSTGGFYLFEIHGTAIPADAVEITTEEHQQLMDGQAKGLRIVANKAGQPVLAEALKPDPKDVVHAQIQALEVQITPRREREALLSGDMSFIKSIDAQVAALRGKL